MFKKSGSEVIVQNGGGELITVPNCVLNDPQLCSNNQLKNYILQMQNQGVDLEEYIVVVADEDEEPTDYQDDIQEVDQESSQAEDPKDLELEETTSFELEPSFEVDDPDIIIEKEIYHNRNVPVKNMIVIQSQPQPQSELKITSAYSVIENIDIEKDNIKLPPIYNDARKPGLSYNQAIILTFIYTKSKVMPVQDIYKGLRELFPYFLTAPPNWKNSIRHCLSSSSMYIKIQRLDNILAPTARPQCTWSINPAKGFKLQIYCYEILKRLKNFDPDKILVNLFDSFLTEFNTNQVDDEDLEDQVDKNDTNPNTTVTALTSIPSAILKSHQKSLKRLE